VDGSLDVKPLTCSSCHGDAAQSATPAAPLFAAPPVDTTGSSDPASPGVGAHQAHLTDGDLRSALACTDCHAVPSSNTHADGDADFLWSALATGGGITSPEYAGGSCSATYCHGAALDAGGTDVAPAWTGGAAEVTCGACHATPPPAPHLQNASCGNCHPGYTVSSVDPALHVDGTVDLDLDCTSCHGDASKTATPADPRWAAPPLDTAGEEASAQVGAHQKHLGATLSGPVACAQCHPVPAGFAGHPTLETDFAWGTLATGAIVPTASTDPRFGNFSAPTSPTFAGGSCSATYCHGDFAGDYTYVVIQSDPPEETTVRYAGKAAAPSWVGGPMACDSCHGNPTRGLGVWHSGSHGYPGNQYNDCQYCHPDAVGVNGVGTAITNPSLHVNGAVNLAPRFQDCSSNCHF
jgi:predicted CxxxxCH...CXXCH cytochrome family protein